MYDQRLTPRPADPSDHPCLPQAYALLLVEEEDRKAKEVELRGRGEQLELMCRKNAYLQDKASTRTTVVAGWAGRGH